MRINRHPIGKTARLLACLTVAFVTVLSAGRPAIAAEVAILKSADITYYDETVQGFRAVLPPQTTVEEYSLGGNLTTGQEIARMLRADPPRLVFAVGLKATLAAKLELPDTPVLFSQVLDPESYQLPTERMTGIRVVVSPAQQLATLRALLPHAHRVGLLHDTSDRGAFLTDAERSARRLGITLVPASVRSASDVPHALKTLLPTIDALWVIQDHTVLTEISVPFVLNAALDAKMPIFTFSDTMIKQGALGGLVLQPLEIGRQAGTQAIQLLHGDMTSLGSLIHPEQPHLVLNLRVAEHLGITAPAALVHIAGTLYGTGAVAQNSNQDHGVR